MASNVRLAYTNTPTGQCFDIHGNWMLDCYVKGTLIVHGEVSRPADGLRHSHCWLERNGKVYDYSLLPEMSLEMCPVETYYRIGEIREEPGQIQRYTLEEMRYWILETEHWGPWHLTCKL